MLSPFQAFVIELHGEGELKTLRQLDDVQSPILLSGTAQYAGFYLNELLYRLLPLYEPHEHLFQAYADLLSRLQVPGALEARLREFEGLLLSELGLGLELWPEGAETHTFASYAFDVQEGRVIFFGEHPQPSRAPGVIEGLDPALLKAAARHDWSVAGALAVAKVLHRARIDYVLEGKPLKSRNLLKQYLELGRVEKKSTPGR
ncbi:MAG: DNA repair protein RecO C-terminal domain-containing protein [Hahellaceae bacterium]|nr:DNA repair protein RecO C-terminal domain-containing protein [Hahellaceae bacterium]